MDIYYICIDLGLNIYYIKLLVSTTLPETFQLPLFFIPSMMELQTADCRTEVYSSLNRAMKLHATGASSSEPDKGQ